MMFLKMVDSEKKCFFLGPTSALRGLTFLGAFVAKTGDLFGMAPRRQHETWEKLDKKDAHSKGLCMKYLDSFRYNNVYI